MDRYATGTILLLGLAFAAGCSDTDASEADEDENDDERVTVCGEPCDVTNSVDVCLANCMRDGGLALQWQACTREIDPETVLAHGHFAIDFFARFEALSSALEESTRFSDALAGVLTSLAYDPYGDVNPSAIRYEGAGFYEAHLGDWSAAIEVFLGDHYEVGELGMLVEPNLFVSDTYLLDPEVSLGNFEATIAYSAPGPFVELLGKGPTPSNPVKLSLFEASLETNKLSLATDLDASRGTLGRSSQFELAASLRRSAQRDDRFTEVALVVASGIDQAASLTLEVDEHVLGAVASGFTGHVDFEITGPEFRNRGRIDLGDPGATDLPKLILTCAP